MPESFGPRSELAQRHARQDVQKMFDTRLRPYGRRISRSTVQRATGMPRHCRWAWMRTRCGLSHRLPRFGRFVPASKGSLASATPSSVSSASNSPPRISSNRSHRLASIKLGRSRRVSMASIRRLVDSATPEA